jgi:RimJ/RimL family protein N-acetyltransferase
MEEEVGEMSPASYFFSIRTLAEDKLIGELGLDVVSWPGRDAFVGLGIGETEYWSKGYGTDVMNVLLRFAFTEINLRRVTLSVFEYNPRAIRSYEKAGFRHEGRTRKVLNKEGKRWDVFYMGILREEWMGLDTSRSRAVELP